MKLRIEKGIPIPAPKRPPGKKHGLADVLRKLKVNESVFIAGKTSRLASNSARNSHMETGFTFVVRAVDGGSRVWRTK